MQREYELLKMSNAPKWTSIDPCIGIGKNSLAHYELAYSRRSGQWIVDSSAKWGTEENKRGRE